MRITLKISRNAMLPSASKAVPPNATECNTESIKLEECSTDTNKPKQEDSEHWRNNAEGLRKVNAYALKNNILTDVTFKVGPEAKEIHAHRLILALGSPVFEAMFYGVLAEKENVVVIPDVTPDGFQCLLTYLYTESFTFNNENEAFEACIAAEKYCVPQLKMECERHICLSRLCPVKVWAFLDNSLLLNLEVITAKCLNFLKYRTKLCLQASTFLEASKEAVEHVLELETLEVTELILLKSIVQWAEAKTAGGRNIEEVLYPLIHYIRFRSLTPNEFCSFLEENGKYLDDSDALAILKHLIKPSACKLPGWCCIKSRRAVHTNDSEYHKDNKGESGSKGRNTNRNRHKSRSGSRSRNRRSSNLNELRRNRSRSPRNHSRGGCRIVRMEGEISSDTSESSSDSSSSFSSSDLSSDNSSEE